MRILKNACAFILLTTSLCLSAQTRSFEVTVEGSGQPILLFPGFTCTADVWDSTIVELSKEYECHLFTFAGFGDVPAIEKPWLSKIKNDIVNYVSNNKIENAILIGHSLGGALALWLASEENSTYSKLIVVDALPSTGALMIPNFNSETIVYESEWNKQLLEMDAAGFDAMATQMAFGMTLNEEKRKQLKEWILLADRETYVYGYTDLLKLDLREDISNIKTPVTILAATYPYGMDMAKSTYEGQYKKLGRYEIEYAEGSAHFIMYDKPEWFLDQIMKHIK
ncbi:MAG: alpha/beta fold hydrolase [Flavobacteriaceae bacterium]